MFWQPGCHVRVTPRGESRITQREIHEGRGSTGQVSEARVSGVPAVVDSVRGMASAQDWVWAEDWESALVG